LNTYTNPYLNTYGDKNQSNFLKNINKTIEKDNLKIKTINDSKSRLNAELEDLKVKEKQMSQIKNEKSLKPSNAKENDEIVKRIDLFLVKRKSNTNRKKYVKLSKFEFFMSFIPFKYLKNKSLINKIQLITKAEEKILEYLDVCSYTNLIENFEKLKLILFNNYQNLSLEYLKNRNPSELLKENYNNELLGTVKYFKEKIKESNFNKQDENILKTLNKEFKELIIY